MCLLKLQQVQIQKVNFNNMMKLIARFLNMIKKTMNETREFEKGR